MSCASMRGWKGCLIWRSFFIDCEHRRACGLRFDSQQAQTFTQFVHPLSRHCGEADYALARSMRATRTHKVFLMNAEHKTPDWLKFVDHTADAGIAVEAPDLARLFERAACGMFCVITDLVAVRAMETTSASRCCSLSVTTSNFEKTRCSVT
jgi:Archease protein family (MTH1598/TM1083)